MKSKYYKVGLPKDVIKRMRKFLEERQKIPKDMLDVEVVDRFIEVAIHSYLGWDYEGIPSTEEYGDLEKGIVVTGEVNSDYTRGLFYGLMDASLPKDPDQWIFYFSELLKNFAGKKVKITFVVNAEKWRQ